MAIQKIRKPKVTAGQLWSECEKKHRYPNELEAQHVIKARIANGGHDRLRYYECRFCNGFHLTKQVGRGRRR